MDVVETEAVNSERGVVDKPTSTVALDYGEILVGPNEKVRLYGIPGQRRFDFMWEILTERAQGMILLVPADGLDPVGDAIAFLDRFTALYDRGGIVVGLTRADLSSSIDAVELGWALAQARPSAPVPVLTLDPRERAEMRMALLTLVANLEAREAAGYAP